MRPASPLDDIVEHLVNLCALIAGIVILAIALITTWSIVSRNVLDSPVLGDVELVGLGMASAVAYFLPICQWRGSNIIVDFFTLRASESTKRWLDGFGSLLMCLMMALLAWRTAVGAAAMRQVGQTTMLLELPEWMAYAAMVPAMAITAIVALYTIVRGTPHNAAGNDSSGETIPLRDQSL